MKERDNTNKNQHAKLNEADDREQNKSRSWGAWPADVGRKGRKERKRELARSFAGATWSPPPGIGRQRLQEEGRSLGDGILPFSFFSFFSPFPPGFRTLLCLCLTKCQVWQDAVLPTFSQTCSLPAAQPWAADITWLRFSLVGGGAAGLPQNPSKAMRTAWGP